MNMKSNVKRYLAALLTVIMIFQQSGANAIFASSENIPAATTTEEEVAAQSEEPEEEEPDAEEPEEEDPEQTPEEQPDEDQQEPEAPEEPEQPQTPEEPETSEEPEQPKDETKSQDMDGESNDAIVSSSGYIYSNDLNNFITNVSFKEAGSENSVEDGDGNVILKKNREYTLDLSFVEQENAGGFQFQSPLTYDLKSKLGNDFDYVNAGGTVDIIVTDTNTNQKVTVTGTYSFSTDGQLIVNLPDDDTLNRAGDAQFNVKLNVKTTETITGKKYYF